MPYNEIGFTSLWCGTLGLVVVIDPAGQVIGLASN